MLCDPHGQREGESLLPAAAWEKDPYLAAKGADAVVLLTEWNMFRALDLKRLKAGMTGDVLVDLRNVYKPEEAAGAGLAYSSIGRPSS